MSGVKANWHVEAASWADDIDTDSPFSVPIEEIGERIDLRDPKAALDIRLGELLRREGNLDAVGVTCPIKDRPDTTCHACPVSQAHDPSVKLCLLCRVGREQETVLTELAVLACRVR